jgi:hypothetical protein
LKDHAHPDPLPSSGETVPFRPFKPPPDRSYKLTVLTDLPSKVASVLMIQMRTDFGKNMAEIVYVLVGMDLEEK